MKEFARIAKDVNTFHYEEDGNMQLDCETFQVVYEKVARYIINLTLIVFMQKFISFYFLVMSCYELDLE